MTAKNLLGTRNGRFLTFGFLYISEGLAYGFSANAIVTFMRQQSMSLELIGSFSAVLILPWAFKWAWAPLIDVVKLNRFGGRKAWLLLCQAMMIVTLWLIASGDFAGDYRLLLVMVVLNNFFCATLDVAIDSLAVATLQRGERGRGNGFMFGGQYLGIALGGGGSIYIAGHWGFTAALFWVSGLLLLGLVFVMLFVSDPAATLAAPDRRAGAWQRFTAQIAAFVRDVYVSFFRSGTGPVVGLVFAVAPMGAMALAYALIGSMNVDYGLSNDRIAQLTVYMTLTSGIGCILGGVLGDRFGLKRVMALTYTLSAVFAAALGWQIASIGLTGIPQATWFALVLGHNLCFGMSFGLRAGVLMGMTNPAVAATQFTTFMALGNVAISYSNYWQGLLAERFDYSLVLYLDAAAVLLPVLLIPFLRERRPAAVAGSNTLAPVSA